MTFYKALEHIKERPQIYFEEPLNLGHLQAFIYGFQIASKTRGIILPNGMSFDYFNSWLAGTVKKTYLENRNWRKIIEHTAQNKEQEIELFFDLIFKFGKGKIKVTKQETEPISLKWKQNRGKTKLEDFEEIEEIIIRYEIWEHQFSETKFKIGYNSNDFKVSVEPELNGEFFRIFNYTE